LSRPLFGARGIASRTEMEALMPWIVTLALLVALLALLVARRWPRQRDQQPKPLPSEWALAPRPVFSTDERRVYRQLREALPHHIILSKLPLVRFCQPSDPNEVRYWYELLGSIHVTFAICSANGRVLAAIDLDTDRGNSRRVMQIKQSVLGACRVRYLRCPVDNLPSIAELQLLVPQASAASRGPQPAPSRPPKARPETAPRRRERATLWQDSSFFQDSFFAPDNRLDSSSPGEIGPYEPSRLDPRGDRADNSEFGVDGIGREMAADSEPPALLRGTGTHN
jgi:Protein of unknown function (DUF2726)